MTLIKRWSAGVLIVLGLWAVVPASAEAAGRQPPRQEEFVPVDQLPADDQLPAAPLLIAAYAVAWLAILGYFVSIRRRLGAVERELDAVARRVDAGRRT
jgi:CcmD family protein